MRPAHHAQTGAPAIRVKTLFLFVWLLFLSFALWLLLLLVVKDHHEQQQQREQADSSKVFNERAPPQSVKLPQISSVAITKPQHQQLVPMVATSYSESRLEPRSLGLVVLTSVNGGDRSAERQRIFDSLCSGNNADLLKQYGFSLYLSVDGLAKPTPGLASSITCRGLPKVEEWYTQSTAKGTGNQFDESSTGRITAHYRAALKQAFQRHTHVIFLEDDLLPSPDFVSLFVPTSPAFRAFEADQDRVWCISAWNDLGVSNYASDLERLFRTEYFPGLGWMTNRNIWEDSIRTKWSLAASTGWDNWLRSNNDQERECIVPEVNRVKHISSQGTNVQDPDNQLYGVFSFSARSSQISWKLMGDYSSKAYDVQERQSLMVAERIDLYKQGGSIVISPPSETRDVLIIYERSQYKHMLQALGANPPMKEEPRSYRQGLITLRKEQGTFYYLCDMVLCAPRYFPSETFFKPTVTVLRASKGKSCKDLCESHQLQCDDVNQQTVAYPPGRACVIMRTYFDCVAGCGHQVGAELPAMAVGKGMLTLGQCLTGVSAVTKCDSSHMSTQRLCSCVK